MTDLPIRISYKLRGSWTFLERELVAPLVDIASWWLNTVRTRVESSGQGSRGPLTPYADHGGDGRFWVPPGRLQPQPSKYRLTEGRMAGWAVYPSYDFWLGLTGRRRQPRRLKESGAFWSAYRVRAESPQHTSIRPVGSNKKGLRNDRLARQLMAKESQGLLTPTDAEWAHMRQMWRDSVSSQLLEAQDIATETQGLRRATARVQSRANKLVRRISAT